MQSGAGGGGRFRRVLGAMALAAALAPLVPAGGAAWAIPISHVLTDYVQSVGRPDFFDGRLLTADDLNDEQQYQRQKMRFLPDTDELTLADLFRPAGVASVTLVFDDADLTDTNRVDDGADPPQSGDFVVLDGARGRWRGQIYLADAGGAFELEGTFTVSEPATLAVTGVLAVAVLAFAGASRRRHQKEAGP